VITDRLGVDASVSRAAGALVQRRNEFTSGLLTLFAAEIAPLQHDDQLLGLLAASTEENVVTALHLLEHGIDPQTLDAPTAALEYARRLAQRSIPLSALLRSYRLGAARFLEALLHEVSTQPQLDPAVAGAAGIRVSQFTASYIDRVSEMVVVAYENEREVWLNSRSATRAARVQSLLNEQGVDVAAAEQKLGYRLQQRHLSVHLWIAEPSSGGEDQLLQLERLGATAASALGAGHPLFVPDDEGSAFLWFGALSEHADYRTLAELVSAAPVPLRAAVGEPAHGLAGFRRTHRQATQAKAVAVAAGADAAPVTAFRDVGAVALLCSDLAATREWVADTLGDLALDDQGVRRLRETTHVFLAQGCSYTAAGEVLSLHKNSVQYRVQKADQLRGRPVREGRSDVELALRACRLLGHAVLRPAR
jgi:hypothetical protein